MPTVLLALLTANNSLAAQKTYTVTVIDQNQQAVEDAAVIAPTDAQRNEPERSFSAIMDQQDRQFHPRVLVVETGTEVSFPNSDNIRHHVYSFSEPKRFEIKLYADTPNKPVAFDTPGIVVLGCNIHDNMVGYIFVSDSPIYNKTNINGQATLVTEEQEPTALRIWHPLLDDPTSFLELENIVWSQTGETIVKISTQEPVTQTKKSRFR